MTDPTAGDTDAANVELVREFWKVLARRDVDAGSSGRRAQDEGGIGTFTVRFVAAVEPSAASCRGDAAARVGSLPDVFGNERPAPELYGHRGSEAAPVH